MELGVLYDLRNPPSSGISNAEIYAETLEHIEAMEALGFDVVWLTEHHFIDDSYLPATLTMAAAVAARTERVTIGTAVLLLPLHDPLKVAEEAAVVDLLSGGRLRLGRGLGYKLQEFDVFGVDRRHRRGLMEEGVEVIRRAWADGPFTYEGRHHRYHDLDVTPKPTQRPGPEIWLAGRDPVPAERAARLGDGLIATPGPDTFASYLEARTRLGRTGSNNLCTFAFTYPTDDPERAVAELGSYAAYRMALYGLWYGVAADLAVDEGLRRMGAGESPVPVQSFFATPAEVAGQLKDLASVGVDSVLWFATLPGARPSAPAPFFETLIRDVKPQLG